MKLAIVEDDVNVRKSLEIFLGKEKDLEVISFRSGKDALKALDDSYELIITDINMPQMDGFVFLKEARDRLGSGFEAIIITGNATLSYAVDALRIGAMDFLTKPFAPEMLLEAVLRVQKLQNFKKNNLKQSIKDERLKEAEEKSAKTKAGAKGGKIDSTIPSNSPFKGHSKALENVLKIINKAALTDVSILLLGESGVGKEVFANYIHDVSPRREAPFIAINMAAIPEHLLESELFGYEKGAFTDASSAKKGLFEIAEGGSIFLDEIGEMPINLQAKLLRVLQEKEITHLGGTRPIKVDVRIISATNANLQERIRDKSFREDLYFRLATIPMQIPPLRERTDEIEAIALAKLATTIIEYGLEEKSLSPEALERLKGYAWPGNIRELLSVIERAAILSDSKISEADLFLDGREYIN